MYSLCFKIILPPLSLEGISSRKIEFSLEDLRSAPGGACLVTFIPVHTGL